MSDTIEFVAPGDIASEAADDLTDVLIEIYGDLAFAVVSGVGTSDIEVADLALGAIEASAAGIGEFIDVIDLLPAPTSPPPAPQPPPDGSADLF